MNTNLKRKILPWLLAGIALPLLLASCLNPLAGSDKTTKDPADRGTSLTVRIGSLPEASRLIAGPLGWSETLTRFTVTVLNGDLSTFGSVEIYTITDAAEFTGLQMGSGYIVQVDGWADTLLPGDASPVSRIVAQGKTTVTINETATAANVELFRAQTETGTGRLRLTVSVSEVPAGTILDMELYSLAQSAPVALTSYETNPADYDYLIAGNLLTIDTVLPSGNYLFSPLFSVDGVEMVLAVDPLVRICDGATSGAVAPNVDTDDDTIPDAVSCTSSSLIEAGTKYYVGSTGAGGTASESNSGRFASRLIPLGLALSKLAENAAVSVSWRGKIVVVESLSTDPSLTSGYTITMPVDIFSADPWNPCEIALGSAIAGSLFSVDYGGDLALADISVRGETDGTSYFYYADTGLVTVLTDGTFSLQNGARLGGNTASSENGGGGVSVFGGTFNMEGGSIYSCTAAYGGGVHVEPGIFVMNGGTIGTASPATPNGANLDGGGVYVTAGGSVYLYDGVIAGNYANGYGGGISVACGSLFIDGAVIETNTGSYGGGGIHAEGTTEMFADVSISESDPANPTLIRSNMVNTESEGGGIYTGSQCTLTMSGGTITGHSVSYASGAGVRLGGTMEMTGGSIAGNETTFRGGGISVVGGTLNLDGGSITGNSAAQGGGGIFCAGLSSNSMAILTIAQTAGRNTLIAENTCPGGNGGGLLLSGWTDVLMTGGNITTNQASHTEYGGGNGGGVCLDSQSSSTAAFVMSGGIILGNNAVNGGGIYASGYGASGDMVKLLGDTIMINENIATRWGGGIYGDESAQLLFRTADDTADNPAWMNLLAGNTGGFFPDTVRTIMVASESELDAALASSIPCIVHLNANIDVVTPKTVSGRTVAVSSAPGFAWNLTRNADNLGPLFEVQTGGRLVFFGQVQVDGMKSSSVYANGPLVAVTGGKLCLQDSAYLMDNYSSAGGGAVTMTAGSFEMTGGNLSSNVSASGGGGLCVTGGELILNGGCIQGNNAISGGGVYLAGASQPVQFGGTFISENNLGYTGTPGGGGGMYVGSGVEVHMTGGEISLNTTPVIDSSNVYGGGVFIDGGIFLMSGGNVGASGAANQSLNGGGICMASGALAISGGNVSFNQGISGGGICVEGGSFTLTGGSFAGNSATTGGGLFYASTYAPGTISGSAVFSANSVGYSGEKGGGGIYIASGCAVEMSGGMLVGNWTPIVDTNNGHGGGVYVDGGSFTLTGGSVGDSGAGNMAIYGGGIYLNSGALLVDGGRIYGNTGDGEGGGIYAYGTEPMPASITLNESNPAMPTTIAGNQACSGAGICLGAYSGAAINGGTVSENNGSLWGGGVYVHNFASCTTGGSVSGNMVNGAEQNFGYDFTGTLLETSSIPLSGVVDCYLVSEWNPGYWGSGAVVPPGYRAGYGTVDMVTGVITGSVAGGSYSSLYAVIPYTSCCYTSRNPVPATFSSAPASATFPGSDFVMFYLNHQLYVGFSTMLLEDTGGTIEVQSSGIPLFSQNLFYPVGSYGGNVTIMNGSAEWVPEPGISYTVLVTVGAWATQSAGFVGGEAAGSSVSIPNN